MKHLLLPAFALILASCGAPKSADENKENTTEEMQAAVCSYTIAPDSAQVYWEAYKLTEKIAVGGQFSDVDFTAVNTTSANVPELLNGTNITIQTASVNSGDVVRDPKLVTFFFNVMEMGETITGKIISSEGDNVVGTATASITMNNVEQNIVFNYEVNEDEIKLYAEIDVNNWKGEAALASLGKACEAKHTGPDGKNVLWPTVAVKFFLPYSTDCN